MLKIYNQLTKSGIVLFVIIGGLVGFAISYPVHATIDLSQVFLLISGLYFLSSGSFALNQAQEWKCDSQMPRTSKRPIPMGQVSVFQAAALGIMFVLLGSFLLLLVSIEAALVGALTIVLYNGFYTMHWKHKWGFGAVPGAIPGALPVVIGYAANRGDILSLECVYLFLIMFFWQMPHFWSLAIHYKDDYQKGGVPVLPTVLGQDRTLYHIGLYTFVYVAIALAAPLFTKVTLLHFLVVVPFAFKVLFEFFKYYKNHTTKEKWLPFFMWVNVSLLVFLSVPVFEKWLFYKFH